MSGLDPLVLMSQIMQAMPQLRFRYAALSLSEMMVIMLYVVPHQYCT